MSPPCSSRRLRIVMTVGLLPAVSTKKGTVRRCYPSCVCSTHATCCFLLPISHSESCMKTMPAFRVEEIVRKGRELYSEFLERNVVRKRDIVTLGGSCTTTALLRKRASIPEASP